MRYYVIFSFIATVKEWRPEERETTHSHDLVACIPPTTIQTRSNSYLILYAFLVSQTGIHVYNRIEIYSAEGSQSTGWACTKRASPGNLVQVEDLLFSLNANVGGNGSNSPCADSSNNVTQGAIVMCVRVAASSSSSEGGGTSNNQEKTIGIAYTDATSDRKIGVCEFADSDTFANFEIMMVQLGVRECVLAMDNSASAAYDLKKIRMLLNKAGIAVTERKKSKNSVKC